MCIRDRGEAVAQSQRVAAQREALIDLVLGGAGPDLAAVTLSLIHI